MENIHRKTEYVMLFYLFYQFELKEDALFKR